MAAGRQAWRQAGTQAGRHGGRQARRQAGRHGGRQAGSGAVAESLHLIPQHEAEQELTGSDKLLKFQSLSQWTTSSREARPPNPSRRFCLVGIKRSYVWVECGVFVITAHLQLVLDLQALTPTPVPPPFTVAPSSLTRSPLCFGHISCLTFLSSLTKSSPFVLGFTSFWEWQAVLRVHADSCPWPPAFVVDPCSSSPAACLSCTQGRVAFRNSLLPFSLEAHAASWLQSEHSASSWLYYCFPTGDASGGFNCLGQHLGRFWTSGA